MRVLSSSVAAAVCVIAASAHAGPHRHGHLHHHQKKHAAPAPGNQVVEVPGVPEIVYQFEGATITESEVCKGILNGTFVWAEGTNDKPDCKDYLNPPAPAPSPAAAQDTKQAEKVAPSNAESKLALPASGGSSSSSDSSTFGGDGGDCEKEFQDGVHDCSEFPEQYGAVKVPWMNLGGWSGVQYTSVLNGVVGDIKTALGGQGCASGAYCSYACPAGSQKSQWPDQQSGTSVGGLLCQDGKLHRSNPAFSQICIQGTGKANVQNKLGSNVPICRTDYPGTESETIPVNTQPGQTYPLTCPDAKTYYQHEGASTSAQYYVNMAGVAMDVACTWGQDETGSGKAYGNWAPVNMGVGTNADGATFISLLSTEQNYPDAIVPLGFNIEIQGDLGGSKCMYVMQGGQGHFCSSGTLQNPSGCQAQGQYKAGKGAVPGCTVQVFSGQATYVLSHA